MNTPAAVCRLALLGLAAITCFVVALPAQTPPPPAKRLPPAGIPIPEAARQQLTTDVAVLRREIDALASDPSADRTFVAKLLPDVEICHKAVDWALRYDEFFDAKQVAQARHFLQLGHERVAQLRAGQAPWLKATGLIVRGYRSKIDGSIQPYGLYLPANLPSGPQRLLVWLLGRGDKRTELAFLAEREAGPPQLTPANTMALIPYGRFCNATKFAGEVDVFEALAAVRETYTIDADRITVAGFSMGGASTWHLATHHAGLWCAAAPGAGFAETPIYTKAFAPGKEPRTPWEQQLWHWYNATDYAGNLFNCPTVAYSGEIDPQKQSADLMEEAMAKEGLKLERLIGPQTAHKYHPDSKATLTSRLEALGTKGRDAAGEVHLTTYTLRYPGDSWAQIVGLEKHWERADLRARVDHDTLTVETKNVSAFKATPAATVVIDGQKLSVRPGDRAAKNAFVKTNGKWTWAAYPDSNRSGNPLRKLPGSSGPIDDAFMDSFVFVRPTGQPLNERIGRWTSAELAHATKMWRDIFRGDARIKDDTAVQADDIARSNLVLWGDPSSNAVLKKILPQLPLQWTAKELAFRGKAYSAADHAAILIFPNPLNPQRYIVLNSGIDFRNEAYGTNALQTPKLPDYAIVDLREPAGARWPGKIVDAGFFDENWK